MALYAPPIARSGELGMSVSLPIFIHRSRQRSGFKRAVSQRRVIGKYFFRQVHNRKLWPIEYVRGTVVRARVECPSWILSEIIMRSSSSFVAPSAIAILSTALLCSLSGTAMSQPETGVAAPLPSITVVAPKQVARQVARPTHAAVAYRPTAATAQTPPKGSVLARIAEFEKAASSCNGGCETSYKTGNAPWVGCSETGPEVTNFSGTCRDTLSYKTYLECKETKMFLGADQKKAWWLCTSLLIGGKLSGEKVYVADGSGRR
jgi:hypothetical protein